MCLVLSEQDELIFDYFLTTILLYNYLYRSILYFLQSDINSDKSIVSKEKFEYLEEFVK